MGWYVRPGMGSKKAMASRVGTGALGGQRRYRFRFTCAVEGEMEGRGGVRTISTGRLSWLYFFCSWVVCSSTYMGRGRVARIRYIEPLGHAARKAASAQLLPQARTWGTLEPRRSCTLAARGCAMAAMYAKGGGAALLQQRQTVRAPAPVRTPLQRAEPGARSGSRSCGKPPVVQRRGLLLTPVCPQTPPGSQAARVICALHTHTHTPHRHTAAACGR